MSIEQSRRLPEAAADALDALAHLVLFAAAEGHRDVASCAMSCLEKLLGAPGARQVIPAEYFDRGLDPAGGTTATEFRD